MKMTQLQYLDAGIYTFPEVAGLVGATQPQVRGWATGYPGSKSEPIIRGEFKRLSWRITLSFKNLIEALFIKCFADEGFSVQAIRAMAEEARRVYEDPHPFARDILFRTDGKAIFAQVFNDVANNELYNLRNHNFAFEDIMEPFLKQPPEYGPDGYAHIWYPRKEDAPHVLLNPAYAFGKPVMEESGIPVRTLSDAVRAEDGDFRKVARWYETSEDEVKEALRFEQLH